MDMKSRKFLTFIVFFLSLSLFVASGKALASYAEVTVSVDWSKLVVTGNITWTGYWTEVWSICGNNTEYEEQDNSVDDWTSTLDLPVTVMEAKAHSYADSNELKATVKAGPYGTVEPYAYGYTTRGGYFEVLSKGWITFSVPYTISYTLSASSDPGAYAKGGWGAGLYFSVGSGSRNVLEWFDMTALPGETLTDSYSGTLYGRLFGRAGDDGEVSVFVQANSEAYSAVPAPATLLLLGTGLFALKAFSLKKTK